MTQFEAFCGQVRDEDISGIPIKVIDCSWLLDDDCSIKTILVVASERSSKHVRRSLFVPKQRLSPSESAGGHA